MENQTVGQFLSALRKSRGVTQQELADSLGVSNKTVSGWECDTSCPDVSLIPEIADYYGVTCDEILRGRKNSACGEREIVAAGKSETAKRYLLRKHLNRTHLYFCITVGIALLSLFSLILFLIWGKFNLRYTVPAVGFFLSAVFGLFSYYHMDYRAKLLETDGVDCSAWKQSAYRSLLPVSDLSLLLSCCFAVGIVSYALSGFTAELPSYFCAYCPVLFLVPALFLWREREKRQIFGKRFRPAVWSLLFLTFALGATFLMFYFVDVSFVGGLKKMFLRGWGIPFVAGLAFTLVVGVFGFVRSVRRKGES